MWYEKGGLSATKIVLDDWHNKAYGSKKLASKSGPSIVPCIPFPAKVETGRLF